MSSLIILLEQYPILESFSFQCGLGNLIALSRTSTAFRALLHGFESTISDQEFIKDTKVRQGIRLGCHETQLWKNLKHNSRKLCSDPSHTRGGEPRGCRICSAPICGACVVKKSFSLLRNDQTFPSRRRNFCAICWTNNRPHRERLRFIDSYPIRLLYAKVDMCRCTAKDGILCTPCRAEQQVYNELRCAGDGCFRFLGPDHIAGRLCTWCNLALPASPTWERSWTGFQHRESEIKRREPPLEPLLPDRPPKKMLLSFDYQRFDPAATSYPPGRRAVSPDRTLVPHPSSVSESHSNYERSCMTLSEAEMDLNLGYERDWESATLNEE